MTNAPHDDADIAVVAMAGRFPNAPDIGAFWASCRQGKDQVTRWGSGPSPVGPSPVGRVLAGGLLADHDLFDAEAFGVSPAEAELLDPQHRVFLEICWDALDQAAVVPDDRCLVSVYAAAAPSRYRPVADGPASETARYQQMIANGPDFLATRVSYLLDLRGEAVNVQTACSSSLVAVHLACQSLRLGHSDVALAGGVSIDPDQHCGYVHEEGMITSPDGHCLPFDAAARGTVPGNGAAVVVLQRLGDALAQGRFVHAVIRATAVNNDGRAKSSFMAPNAQGQAEAIGSALALADIPAESVGYLEAHGTGTRLGDPIEIAAAASAFGMFTRRRGFCSLGSLKANFGHLDRAAGVAGLIKAVHVVREGIIPPLLGFRVPNPDLELDASPFRCPTVPERWEPEEPRRAGVSSFGVGGTNAHAIVEEFRRSAPGEAVKAGRMCGPVALALSAHSGTALTALGNSLGTHLEHTADLAGIVHTLAAGRRARNSRAVVVAADVPAAVRFLRELPAAPGTSFTAGPVAFLFPGQGTAVAYDAEQLCARFPVFREEIRTFAEASGMPERELLSGISGRGAAFLGSSFQPSLAAVQVALARTLEHLGVTADAFCGSSLGEFAAAHMAGVFDSEQLMTILAARDRLMRTAPEGRMMAVACSPEAITEWLLPEVDLSGENWDDRILLSASVDAIEEQRRRLERQGVHARVLSGRLAAHSRLMNDAAAEFRTVISGMKLSQATRPLVSTLTGGWVGPDQAADPEHWVRHLREPLRFRQSLRELMASGYRTFAEAAPGSALTKLVRRVIGSNGQATSLGGDVDTPPLTAFLAAAGELWSAGAPVDWAAANGTSGSPLVQLPTYPFQRRRYWNHSPASKEHDLAARQAPGSRGRLDAPMWLPAPRAVAADRLPQHVIVHGAVPLAHVLAARLAEHGVTIVRSPCGSADLDADRGAVLIDLSLTEQKPGCGPEPKDAGQLASWLERGLLGPLATVRRVRPSRCLVVTRGLWAVAGEDSANTCTSAVTGLLRCAPHDWPGLRTAAVDLAPIPGDPADEAESLLAELAADDVCDVAYRGGSRYRKAYEPIAASSREILRHGGTYLVLGGTGRLGPVVAEAVSRKVLATIVLTGRNPGRGFAGHEERLIAAARDRGCTVLYRTLDSRCPEALRCVLDELTGRYGRVDGIFHLAAYTDRDDFDLLGELTLAAATRSAEAKVRTAAALADELDGRDYDFVALFSSLSTIIGALRFGAYVSANAYLDALATRMRAATGRSWISMVWDGWAEDGIGRPDALGSSDGAELLLHALGADLPVVAPVIRPVERRIAQVRADLDAIVEAGRAGATAPGQRTAAGQVLRIVSQVTGHAEIDERQSFTELGIDSLQMMQIAARLRPVLGETISLGTLLATRSVADIAALFGSAPATEPSRLQREPAAPDGELSTIQERLWFLAQLNPSSDSYNVPFGWTLPADVSVDSARAAVLSVLKRHEMLCSSYRAADDGRPYRAAVPPEQVPVEVSELDPQTPESSFAEITRAFVSLPFDLERNSIRVLLAVGAGAIRLVFVCHHMSVDAWSVRIIQDDLHNLLTGTDIADGKPMAGYQDFVAWERTVREGAGFGRDAEFWRDVLRDLSPTLPSADDDLPEGATGLVGTATRLVSSTTLEGLRAAARAEEATLYIACVAALALALGRWCGTSEVVIGTNLANRSRPEFEGVVGMFVDPIVLRLRVDAGASEATTGTALAHVKERMAAALAHADIAYIDLVRLAGRREGPAGNPLFSVISTMFDADSPGSSLQPLDLPLPTTSKFPLAVEFLPRADGLLVHVLYAADRYLPETIDRFLRHIVRFFDVTVCEGTDAPLSRVAASSTGALAQERFGRRLRHG